MFLLAKSAIGVDISDNSIEILEISKKLNQLSVSAYSRAKIEPGIVNNGKIIDRPRLTEALRRVYEGARPRRFSTKNAIVSVPESKTFIHVFRLPAVISEENLGESVQYEAEETIPLSFDQVYHDYQLITKEKDQQEVLYAAAFKETIDDLRQAVSGAGLNPAVFEPESAALARALAGGDIVEAVAIVDIGARVTVITIYDHHGIRYSDNLNVGGLNFTEKLMAGMKISGQEAARLKKGVGLIKQPAGRKNKIFDLAPIASQIVASIGRAVDYHQQQTGLTIDRAIICGGTSLMPGLLEYLKNELPFSVSRGQPLAGLKHDPAIFGENEEILYANVIGLAKRGVDPEQLSQGINFLSRRDEHKKFEASQPFQPASQGENRSWLKRFLEAAKKNKRLSILGAAFVVLILIFILVLILNSGREEPLIQFQSETPNYNVEY